MNDKKELLKSLEPEKKDQSWGILCKWSLAIVGVWVLYFSLIPANIAYWSDFIKFIFPSAFLKNDGNVDLGCFGDYFGALNCLFAGLAYAAVFVSIKQQNHSLNIQQNELHAQLSEMANSVLEAQRQTSLQIKYQFADEFYRRISLLKIIEKDIAYRKKCGAEAAVFLASNIYKLMSLIKENKIDEAAQYSSKNLHNIMIALDEFKVWGNTFLSLVKDVYDQHVGQVLLEIEKNTETEKKKSIEKEAQNSIRHYQSVLIDSSVWGEHFLLLLLYSALNNRKATIEQLMKYRSFAAGKTASQAKDLNNQFIFKKIYLMNSSGDLEEFKKSISAIYHEWSLRTKVHEEENK